jgi:putative FmdB family regulatory protein
MPTYDYRCTDCKHEFELFQSMTEARKKKCPACGKNTLERLIGTGGAVLFKGSGFYQTDYRTESYKKAAKADAGGSSANGDGKSSSKPDTKADTKADTKPAAKSEPSKPAPKPSSKPDA